MSQFKKSSSKFAAGGANKKGFSFLANDSDSEHETAAPAPVPHDPVALLRDDPLMAAMSDPKLLWGDICLAADPQGSYEPTAPIPERPLLTEDDLWAQPWAADLEMHSSAVYDTASMSDADWETMMSWLYHNGWDIQQESRQSVTAIPDNQPARVWVSPSRFDILLQADSHSHNHHSCHHSHSQEKPKRKPVAVPRFCRAGTACTEEGCRYIHGDTIPRLNEPCAFGAGCGASDPTGLKRSQCLRMHPGETWTPELVVTRPPSAEPTPNH